MSILNARDGQKMNVDHFKPNQHQLSDDALRARLQECQSRGWTLAAKSLEREQRRRQMKEQTNA